MWYIYEKSKFNVVSEKVREWVCDIYLIIEKLSFLKGAHVDGMSIDTINHGDSETDQNNNNNKFFNSNFLFFFWQWT